MGRLQRIWFAIKGDTPYVDQSESDQITVKDLLRFAEKQSEQNAAIVTAVLAQGASQARTMENYIELFKPKYVPSTTLSEREARKAAQEDIRTDEWEGVSSPQMFNQIAGYTTSDGVPPEPSEY